MKLQDELKDSGFVIIASHVQNATKEQVVSFLRSQKVNYTVTSSGSVPGDTGRTIPRAFLFDASGKLAAQGTPGELKSKIHDLVASGPHFLAAGRTYTKLKPIADALKKTTAYGSIVKKLEGEAKKGGAAEEEAKYLSERILAHGRKALDRAKALEAEDAFLAQKRLEELAAQWKGCEVGTGASDRLKELKKDKDFQKELKASTMAHQVLDQCSKLIAQGGKVNLEYAPNQKIAATVRSMVPQIKKKYPDSKAVAKLEEELKTYGFDDI